MEPEGIKTAASDREIKRRYTDLHLDIGIAVMSRLLESEEDVSHLRY
jgi:AMP nucleosidase